MQNAKPSRRQFLKQAALLAGAAPVLAAADRIGTAEAKTKPSVAEVRPMTCRFETPAVLATYTTADHRRRLENIGVCEYGVRKCLRKHLITNYVPGHCLYVIKGSDWTRWQPNEEDERQLADLRDRGIGLIHVWETWANTWGGNPMYQATNPKAFRQFIDMVHRHGIRILPYTTSCFFDRNDASFREKWAAPKEFDIPYTDWFKHEWHLARVSPASPDYRAFRLARLAHIFDEFDVDGIYDDTGYLRPADCTAQENFWNAEVPQYSPEALAAAPPEIADEVHAFRESRENDGAFADLLALIYAEVKRRGRIFKLHVQACDHVRTDLKVYDYLWVGEFVEDSDFERRMTKGLAPYITSHPNQFREGESVDDNYLHTVPYLQFPVMMGQPDYDPSPGHLAHTRWLKRYQPMVEDGTWAYLEITDSDLVRGPLPQDVVVSAYANREIYLVLANYGTAPAEVATADVYVPADQPKEPARQTWTIAGRSLLILRRVGPGKP